jgi:hypothetical protein
MQTGNQAPQAHPSLKGFTGFVDYVCEFYEDGRGIYAKDFEPSVSRSEIAAATITLLEEYDEITNEADLMDMKFEGDSVDREYLRNILEEARGGERFYIREELTKKRAANLSEAGFSYLELAISGVIMSILTLTAYTFYSDLADNIIGKIEAARAAGVDLSILFN